MSEVNLYLRLARSEQRGHELMLVRGNINNGTNLKKSLPVQNPTTTPTWYFIEDSLGEKMLNDRMCDYFFLSVIDGKYYEGNIEQVEHYCVDVPRSFGLQTLGHLAFRPNDGTKSFPLLRRCGVTGLEAG